MIALSFRFLFADAALSIPTSALLGAAATLGWMIAVSLRSALTKQVPPIWLTVPAPFRPILAVLVGGLVTFFASLKAGQSWQVALGVAGAAMVAAAMKVMGDERTGAALFSQPPAADAPAALPPVVASAAGLSLAALAGWVLGRCREGPP